MELEEYVERLKEDTHKGNASKKLFVDKSVPPTVNVGGSFDDLIETLLKDDSWRSYESIEARRLLKERKEVHEYLRPLKSNSGGSQLLTSKKDITINNLVVTFNYKYPTVATIRAVNNDLSEFSSRDICPFDKKFGVYPYNKLRSNIHIYAEDFIGEQVMHMNDSVGEKSFASIVLYFAEYALNKKVPFMVRDPSFPESAKLEFFLEK